MSPPSRKFRRPWKTVVVVALLAGALGFGLWSLRERIEYTTETVARRTVEATVTAIGSLQPRRYVDVGAQVSGLVNRLHVRPGDVVKKGQLLVDFSSLEPTATREMSAQLASQTGMRWLDAPVSGGVIGAEAGSLAIMVGGEAADLERVRPVLLSLGQRVTHMGAVGAGQVTKACNQMIVACNALVIAEVVALAERSGVQASLIAQALAGGFADSKPLQILAPQMAESRFEPVKWHVRTLLKDLDTAVKFSREQGSATPISGLAAQLMRLHGSQGFLEKDPSTLVQLYREPDLAD